MVDRMSWDLQRKDSDFCLEYQKSFFLETMLELSSKSCIDVGRDPPLSPAWPMEEHVHRHEGTGEDSTLI